MSCPSTMPMTAHEPPGATTGTIPIHAMPTLAGSPGLAGAFAGIVDHHLLAGGGANFPDGVMPWNGGKKVWHDTIYALDLTNMETGWRLIGRLPKPNAYGVSLTVPEGVLLIGGGDMNGHFCEALLLSLTKCGQLQFRNLPDLPTTLAYMSAALVGRHVHVCGGIEAPAARSASRAHWSLDLDHTGAGWLPQPELPAAGRILAMAAALDESFFLIGGCALVSDTAGNPCRNLLNDGWKFSGGHWSRLANLPYPLAATGSPAPVAGHSIFLLSGDDGTQMGLASPELHTGFSKRVLRYNSRTDTWSTIGELDVPPPVTLPVVPWKDRFIFFNGEIKPGLRTPKVFAFTPSLIL